MDSRLHWLEPDSQSKVHDQSATTGSDRYHNEVAIFQYKALIDKSARATHMLAGTDDNPRRRARRIEVTAAYGQFQTDRTGEDLSS
jgi:hypothetical protein